MVYAASLQCLYWHLTNTGLHPQPVCLTKECQPAVYATKISKPWSLYKMLVHYLWFISCVSSKLRSSVIKYTIFKEKSGIFYFICWWNKLVIVSVHFTLKMGKSSSSLLAHQKEHFLIIFEEPTQENNIYNAVMNVKCFVCLELITFWWSTLSSQ